jgi:hypothetical protein
MKAAEDLPPHPARGSRLSLDRSWMALLLQGGIGPFLTVEPEPPPELGRAVAQFNQGRYWECHETLERLWLPERYPLRLFYHGLIKAAVGLLHLEGRNRRGAALKLRDAADTLAPFLPGFMGIDVGSLHLDVEKRLFFLGRGGSTNWEAVESLPPVQIRPASPSLAARRIAPG